jgi:PncC family amidohydrolase
MTAIAGSSDYVKGGVVSYANEVKEDLVGVPHELIETHGAVSEPVARAMAEGVKARLGTGVGVGVTGVAGPGGGSAEKPVGLVYIGVSTPWGTQVRRDVWPGDRGAVRAASVCAALELLLECLGSGKRSA